MPTLAELQEEERIAYRLYLDSMRVIGECLTADCKTQVEIEKALLPLERVARDAMAIGVADALAEVGIMPDWKP
jgi:hypothetical protein